MKRRAPIRRLVTNMLNYGDNTVSYDILDFWIKIMNTLDTGEDLYKPVPGVIQELCKFFHFGCGFVYLAEPTGLLVCKEQYAVYRNSRLPDFIDLKSAMGPEMLKELKRRRMIVANGEIEDPVAKKVLALFGANMAMVSPIVDQKETLLALVGVMDRRGVNRLDNVDMVYSYSILRQVSNHIKLHLFQQRVIGAEKAMRDIMDNMGIDIYVNDFYTHEILYVNRSLAEQYGGAEKMIGEICWKALYDRKSGQCDFCPQHKLIDEEGKPTKVYSWDYCRPSDGAWFRVFGAAFRWVDGRLAQVVSSVDITENKRNEALIRQLAEIDELTGIPNRRKMWQDCEAYLQGGGANAKRIYAVFIDLDGFKAVNDRFGHRAGDELLCAIASFLSENKLTEGCSYRYGGDEFVILCPKEPAERLERILQMLLKRFHMPWSLTDGEAVCQASIGVAGAPEDAGTAGELLHKADMAMYAAKKKGGEALMFDGGNLTGAREYFLKHPPHSETDSGKKYKKK